MWIENEDEITLTFIILLGHMLLSKMYWRMA
jgi:hypothetical protein